MTLRSKLHKNKDIEKIAIQLIEEDKNIANNQISEILRSKYNYKISPSTISNWRQTYYQQLRSDITEESKNQVDKNLFEKIDLKYEFLRSMISDLKVLEDRKKVISNILKEKIRMLPDGTIKPYLDPVAEQMYKDYTVQCTTIKEKIIKNLSDQSPYEILNEILQRTLEEIILIMKIYDVPSAGLNRLKEYFRELYLEYKTKYDIKMKN